jgi:hypothetical protein|tara:strand:- start:447 stop:671 length:225 start_codon:yes stop_codon:yes gene_type:complete
MKKLTPEQRAMKDAMKLRVLSLYREQSALKLSQIHIGERISHLEEQIENIGGFGMDVEETFRNFKYSKNEASQT